MGDIKIYDNNENDTFYHNMTLFLVFPESFPPFFKVWCPQKEVYKKPSIEKTPLM